MRPRVPLAPSLSEPGSSANHLKKQLKEQKEGAEHPSGQERGGDLQAESSTLHFQAFGSLHRVLWDEAELFVIPARPGGWFPQTHLVQVFQAVFVHCKEARKGK